MTRIPMYDPATLLPMVADDRPLACQDGRACCGCDSLVVAFDKTKLAGRCKWQFTDQSVPSPGAQLVFWEWKFYDGATAASPFETSNEQNPIHEWDDSGSHLVVLRIRDSAGCEGVVQGLVECAQFNPLCQGLFPLYYLMQLTNNGPNWDYPTPSQAPMSPYFCNANGPDVPLVDPDGRRYCDGTIQSGGGPRRAFSYHNSDYTILNGAYELTARPTTQADPGGQFFIYEILNMGKSPFHWADVCQNGGAQRMTYKYQRTDPVLGNDIRERYTTVLSIRPCAIGPRTLQVSLEIFRNNGVTINPTSDGYRESYANYAADVVLLAGQTLVDYGNITLNKVNAFREGAFRSRAGSFQRPCLGYKWPAGSNCGVLNTPIVDTPSITLVPNG